MDIVTKIEDLPNELWYPEPGFAITDRYHSALRAHCLKTDNIDEFLRKLKALPIDTTFYKKSDPKGAFRKGNLQEILIRIPNQKSSQDSDPNEQTYKSRRLYFLKSSTRKAYPDFHYINDSRIRDNISSRDDGLLATEIHVETSNSYIESLEARLLEGLGGKLEKQDIKKVITILTSQPMGIGKVYKNLLADLVKDRAMIGAEIIDPSEIDKGPIEQFENELEKIQERFTLSKEEISKQRKIAEIKSVHRVVKKLSDMSFQGSEVLLYGDFLIRKDESDAYVLSYVHPLTDYYKKEIRILTLGIKQVLSDYQTEYKNKIGEYKSLHIYGQVSQRLNIEKGIFDITINPYAIY